MFEWATQPFYTLILTFLFAPYFANVVVGDGPLRAELQARGVDLPDAVPLDEAATCVGTLEAPPHRMSVRRAGASTS